MYRCWRGSKTSVSTQVLYNMFVSSLLFSLFFYAGNKSHLKYRNAIAFDIAESILAYLDADDFSLQNRRQERLGDALFFHDALEHSII